MATVHLIAPIVRMGAYTLNLALYFYHMKWGVVTSGVTFVFWLLEAICGGLTFRSVIISGYGTGSDRITPFTNYLAQYPLVLALFFLSCWADPKPTHVDLDGT